MDYARGHIKRYWVFAYRRALGISLMTFAIALAIGVTFSTLMGSLGIGNYAAQFVFWLVLIALTAIVFLVEFAHAHTSCVRFMNAEEHKKHSKYTGLWMTTLVIGAIAFTLPVLFFSSYMEPLIILFGFGGIFWVLYFSVFLLFKHHYHEIAIAALVFWIVFFISLAGINNGVANAAADATFALFVSVITLIVVSGMTGVSLITNASNEFLREFEGISKRAISSRVKKRIR